MYWLFAVTREVWIIEVPLYISLTVNDSLRKWLLKLSIVNVSQAVILYSTQAKRYIKNKNQHLITHASTSLFTSFQHGHLALCSKTVAAAMCLMLFSPDGLHVPIILLPVSHAPCLCLVFQPHLCSLPLKELCPHLQQR